MSDILKWPDCQPSLRTDRLTLRGFRRSDADLVAELAGDGAVALNTENIPYPYNCAQAEEWIDQHESWFQRRASLIMAVCLHGFGDRVIGCISLDVTESQGRGELGYWIGQAYWNCGYCTEAGLSLVKLALCEMCFRKLTSGHLSSNLASQAVLRKLGFEYEGRRKLHVLRGGKEQDVLIYGLHRSNAPSFGPM